MPYHIITLEIELRFYPLCRADSFACQFCQVTNGIVTFQITNNIVIFFFLLFHRLNAAPFTTKFATTLYVEFTARIKTELYILSFKLCES